METMIIKAENRARKFFWFGIFFSFFASYQRGEKWMKVKQFILKLWIGFKSTKLIRMLWSMKEITRAWGETSIYQANIVTIFLLHLLLETPYRLNTQEPKFKGGPYKWKIGNVCPTDITIYWWSMTNRMNSSP